MGEADTVTPFNLPAVTMTISYTLEVANARFAGFSKLLFRWKGSIYKLLYKEFLVFATLYTALSLVYRLQLTADQRQLFEEVALYVNRYTDLIPLSFVLGFYVSLVVNRWWNQYTSIPLPDQLMMVVSANVHGVDERGRILRRTLMRYANLSSVLILRSVSTRVRKRFPTMEHIVEAGFMTRDELKKFDSLYSDFNKYWIPLAWFTNLAAQARREGRVRDDVALRLLMDELNNYRAKCSMLFHYDWISIPLVYTQVAEQIINPFGEDDDDFETNKLIDRNIQANDMHQNLPPAEKDKYWNETTAQPPYTLATASETLKPSFLGSTFDMRMTDDSNQQQTMDAIPNTPSLRTPMLGRFLTAASPAISLKNFGRPKGGLHMLRLRGDSVNSNPWQSEEQSRSNCINEEDSEGEERESSQQSTPVNRPCKPRRLEASEQQKKREEAQITITIEPSTENETTDA
ncbi:BEST2 protein, partial [Polypterus senegalus]